MQFVNLEWANSIPVDWSVCRIKDIASLQSGNFISAEEIAPSGGYPVFGGNGIRGYVAEFTHKGRFALIGRQGALCGNINYAEGAFWATEHAVVASLRPGIDTTWFGETLRIMNLNQYSNAAAQPGLAVERIKFLRLPLPPVDEQRRIATYLDASCLATDAAVTAKREQIEILKNHFAMTVHRAVTTGLDSACNLVDSQQAWLGDVPRHWTPTRIRNVAALSPGYSGAQFPQEDSYVVVPMECVSEMGDMVVSEHRSLEDVGQGMVVFEHGDVLFAKITPCMENGKGAIVPELPTPLAFGSTEFHVLRPTGRIDGTFLYYYTWNPVFRAYAAENMVGAAGQKRVSSRFLKDVRLFLPPMPEQVEISKHLVAQRGRYLDMKTCIEDQIAVLRAYRKSLIHECVTGQRRITDEDVNRVTAHAASLA